MVLAQPKNKTYEVQLKDLRSTYFEIERYLFDKELDKALAKIEHLEQKIKTTKTKELYPIVDAFYSYYFLAKKNYDKALFHAQKSIDNSNTPEAKAYANLTMGIYFHSLRDYGMLSEYALKALKYAEKTNNQKLLGDIYYRLYCVHTQWDDLKTDEYAQKALNSYEIIQDYNGMSNAFSAKVFGTTNQFNTTQNTVYKDSILYYLRMAVTILDKQANTNAFKRTKAVACLNLANHYYELYVNDKEINRQTAIDSINRYLYIVDKIPNEVDYNYALKANSLNIKGNLALFHKEYDKAERLLLKCYNNLKKEKTNPSNYSLFNASVALKDFYLEQKNYKKAIDFLEEQYNYNGKIYDQAQANQTQLLETKFENEKIKQDLNFQQQENKSKKIQLYLSISLLILALSSIILLLRNFKNKMLAKKRKLKLLHKEKQEALIEVKLQEEKYARLVAERKVLEVEKEKVQKKAMANVFQIERKNQLLTEIQKKLEQNNLRITELKSTLKIEKHTEDQMNTKLDEFNEINPQLFKKLKVASNNKLTDLDLKYCAYFYLRLSNKEIANNLNVEAKSVRMTKYRIKKKLNLDKDTKIESFLENIIP